MPRKKITFDTVRAIGLTLPDVEEATMYGTPALKVRGQWLVCVPTHKSAEPDSLAVRADFAQRDEMIAAEPEIYYVKEHYVSYPVVLVRLSRVHPDALADLVTGAWRLAAAADKRRRSRRTPAARRPRRPRR
jgi:hypothetical protein